MTKFIIEHLDSELYDWSLLEYKHISEFIGKNNLIFTNIKSEKDTKKLQEFGEIKKAPLSKLSFENACILDPTAKNTLKPTDEFDYIILGGILGDIPPQDRTKKELTNKLNFPSRNLGIKHMTTNTAAYVAYKIINGTPLEKIKLQDELVIATGEQEEIILPFAFVEENGKLILPKGYIEMISKEY